MQEYSFKVNSLEEFEPNDEVRGMRASHRAAHSSLTLPRT
jgi:hypothetical protein